MYLLMQLKFTLSLLGSVPPHHRCSLRLLPTETIMFICVLPSQIVPVLYLWGGLLGDSRIATKSLFNVNTLNLIQYFSLSKYSPFWFHHQWICYLPLVSRHSHLWWVCLSSYFPSSGFKSSMNGSKLLHRILKYKKYICQCTVILQVK